jgi:glycosyltransferase involved in cell wall biosynthesis
MPTVSVCLPVYNGAKYLGASIESVLAQSYQDFEILISDDCSTDQTSGVMETYAKQDKRVKAWTNEKNLGHYPNYNACIEKASGKYIKLFAQDDLLHPDFLARFVLIFDQNPKVGLVNCARNWLDADGKNISAESETDIKLTKPFAKDTVIPGIDALASTLGEAVNWLGEPSSQMFRAEFVDGGFDVSFRQIGDLEYNYRLLLRGDYYFIADTLCYFRKHSDSWTTANSCDLSSYLDWLVLAAKYREHLTRQGLTPEQFCLNFIKAWTRDLECDLNRTRKLGPRERTEVLKTLCGNVDPLSLFTYKKNEKRELAKEYKALGAIALLHSAMLEYELRLINVEAAQLYTDTNSYIEPMFEVRPGLYAALRGIKETLRARDQEIADLRVALREVGNSLSWKVTQPLRILKSVGSIRPGKKGPDLH